MISIKTKTDDLAAMTSLKKTAEQMRRPEKPLKEFGLALLRSIDKNFKAGGRPVKWPASKRAKKTGDKTLIDTARLKNSISMRVSGDTLTVGTPVKYARIQQLGGKINKNATVKKHWRTISQAFGRTIPSQRVLVPSHSRRMNLAIPARPFLMVQDSDHRILKKIMLDHIAGG